MSEATYIQTSDDEYYSDDSTTPEQIEQQSKLSALELIKSSNISPELIQKMQKHSDLVNECYSIFKEQYKTAIKPTYISDIVNGEVIETKPENIMVSEPIDPKYAIDENNFNLFCQYCTKKLYKYQADAIHKLRELELRGWHYNNYTHKKVISNGWLLSLPIGSGKSLVFQFLSLFYRDVPTHPIIVSTDGRNVPDHDQAELKVYPFYYENCGYIENEANAVITLSDYRQRRQTIILTHQHLLLQMEDYFTTDFPQVSKKTNITYALDIRDIKDLSKVDILVIAATSANVATLSALSYDMPFMRVIIDDYTSMPSIESFRQIRASSTIFVSGSGFNRSESDIPASYYTLKFMPVGQITLVGKPEETYEGILRDSIATMELMGSSCKFSQYRFINECEEYCRATFHANPTDIYPILRTQPILQHYISLMFVLKNLDRLKGAIQAVEHDLITDNPKTGKPYLDRSRLKYYFEWKQMMRDDENKPKPQKIQVKERGKVVTKTIQPPESSNPLYMRLFVDQNIGSSVIAAIIPDAICLNCGKPATEHNGYGMIAACCGGFYCSQCADSCSTRRLINSKTGETLDDDNNYYCCNCRRKNPRYFYNISKKKDSSVYSFNITDEFFNITDLANRAKFDYYFYMFLHGFEPKQHKGRALNVLNDIEQGAVNGECFKKHIIPQLDTILPKDQLAILTVSTINTTLYRLKILPRRGTIIMFYACPSYMQDRVKYYFNEIKAKNNPNTAFQIPKASGRGKELVQPINNVQIVFKSDVGQLIGLHENILGLVVWKKETAIDLSAQLAGRIVRLSDWKNSITFYIECTSSEYE